MRERERGGFIGGHLKTTTSYKVTQTVAFFLICTDLQISTHSGKRCTVKQKSRGPMPRGIFFLCLSPSVINSLWRLGRVKSAVREELQRLLYGMMMSPTCEALLLGCGGQKKKTQKRVSGL